MTTRHEDENRVVLLSDIVETSGAVAAASARRAKIELLAGCLRRLPPAEVPAAVAFLSGELRQGTIGVGYASLRELPPPRKPPPGVTLTEVDAAFTRVQGLFGPGSQAARHAILRELFGSATAAEQRFLRRLLLGELRQGALEGLMAEAIAAAAEVPAAEVRRALMLRGELGPVAAAALGGGDRLREFHLEPLRPVKPMLAQTAEDIDAALARVNPAAVEWKLDGARIQVHRLGDEVRVFTRNLADITERIPEVVEAIRGLPLRAVVLDGEAVVLRDDGRPHPFQVTMSRFGSKLDVDELRESLPLTAFFFDCLHFEGEDLIDLPTAERFAALAGALPEEMLLPRVVVAEVTEATEFLGEALRRGHEGVMVKALDAPYEAGRRGAAWLKVKPAHTLDLVVLAAEWGHGRRRGRLSNLHLGARDPASESFVMLGKTFKGLTDEMLEWQTQRFLELETHREGHVVFVRPEQVVEVAFDGIQASSRYPGGMALRFARAKGYRHDKTADEADTIDTVREIFEGRREPGTG